MSVSYKAGEPIKHEDLQVGMLVTLHRGQAVDHSETGRVTRLEDDAAYSGNIYFWGRAATSVTATLAEEWPAKPVLPEVEGLYLGSYTAGTTLGGEARENVLGEWYENQYGWAFRPVSRSPFFSVGSGRITSLIPVDVVPQEALELLAHFRQTANGLGKQTHDVLSRFFDVVNRVKH